MLGAAPLLVLLVPKNNSFAYFIPFVWTVVSIPFGSMLTAAVWVGLGKARWPWRLLGGILFCFYVAIWFVMYEPSLNIVPQRLIDVLVSYLETAAGFCALVLSVGCSFMVIGRWFELRIPELNTISIKSGIRFSMLQMLLLTSAVAIVLSLLQATRSSGGDEVRAESTGHEIVSYAFLFVIEFINSALAVGATLRLGRIIGRVAMVLLVSLALGVAIALGMGLDEDSPWFGHNWWLFACSTFIAVVPTLVVVVSMLVVRSCGYRLVRRERRVAAAT